MKNLNDQFITYKLAIKLKELGFENQCFAKYHIKTQKLRYECWFDEEEQYFAKAPLWQQAIEWLKEKHNIRISIDLYSDADLYYVIKGQFKGKLGYIESALLVAIALIENNLNGKSIEYFQGSRAGKAGLTPKENPYPKDSKQYDDFLNGMIDSSI